MSSRPRSRRRTSPATSVSMATNLDLVRRQHSPAGQLGIALQLCALRWLGFIPDDLPSAPKDSIAALAAILDAEPRVIFDSSACPQTRREHRPLGREHAGFRAAGERKLEPVGSWLIEQALEHAPLAAARGGLRRTTPPADRAPRGQIPPLQASAELVSPGLGSLVLLAGWVPVCVFLGARPAGATEPPELLVRVATGGLDQSATDRLLPSERNLFLIDTQLPSNQAAARSAEMIELCGNLEQLLQRDRIRPERSARRSRRCGHGRGGGARTELEWAPSAHSGLAAGAGVRRWRSRVRRP